MGNDADSYLCIFLQLCVAKMQCVRVSKLSPLKEIIPSRCHMRHATCSYIYIYIPWRQSQRSSRSPRPSCTWRCITQQTLWSATWPQKSSLAGSGRQQVQWRKRFRVSNTRKSSEQPKLDGRAWVVRNRCGGQELKVNPGESWSPGSWGVSKSTSALPRPLGKASKVPEQDGKGWSRRSWRGVTCGRWSSMGFLSSYVRYIWPPPYPCKSHSMEARQLKQVWHVWGAWYTAAHSQRLPQSSGTGNVHLEARPGSSCHSKGSGEGRRSCKPRIRRERQVQTHPFCVGRRRHWPENWQATEESQDPARRLQLEGRIWPIWQTCFPSCGSHYTSPPWPGHMVRRCQSPHHWGTHRSLGRAHAGSERAQENQVRPPYDRVRRETVAGTLFAIWSWLSRLCGNFSHDVPPQAWHHPPRAQVCMQGPIRCCVESLNMDLGQAQKWSQLMSSGTSQEWFWG